MGTSKRQQTVEVERRAPGAKVPRLKVVFVERRGPDRYRFYVVRGTDLQYHAKRFGDGAVIASADEKTDARTRAENLGYTLT